MLVSAGWNYRRIRQGIRATRLQSRFKVFISTRKKRQSTFGQVWIEAFHIWIEDFQAWIEAFSGLDWFVLVWIKAFLVWIEAFLVWIEAF